MKRYSKTSLSCRKSLIQWSSLFSVFNLVIALIISTDYTTTMSNPENILGWIYLVLVTFGHFAFLIFIIFLLLILPVIMLIPKERLILPLCIIIAVTGVTLLKIDTYVFAQYKFHINLFFSR